MRHPIRIAALLAAMTMLLVACGDDVPDVDGAVAGASAEFVTPNDGDTVSSPVQVEMAAENVTIVPAGDGQENDGEGHFHIMINVDCVDDGEVIPDDDDHRHFGDGSTTTELDLPPGDHELCLQIGNAPHQAYGDTDTISITVE